MTVIENVRGREIIRSRDNPMPEFQVILGSGAHGQAAVPSTGTREAVGLRDGDKSRYGGKGVLNEAPAIYGGVADSLRSRPPIA